MRLSTSGRVVGRISRSGPAPRRILPSEGSGAAFAPERGRLNLDESFLDRRRLNTDPNWFVELR